MFISTESQALIERLAAYLDSGEVVPAIGQRFSLADTADEIRQMEAGTLAGKSVILVRENRAHR
jgi:NADPH:quinone reductase-like Zn-dependent oxidoreductase